MRALLGIRNGIPMSLPNVMLIPRKIRTLLKAIQTLTCLPPWPWRVPAAYRTFYCLLDDDWLKDTLKVRLCAFLDNRDGLNSH